MTREEFEALDTGCPPMLMADGKYGLCPHWNDEGVLVDVYGKGPLSEETRLVPWKNIAHAGGGAVLERVMFEVESRCPYCDATHTRATATTGRVQPKAGDATLCFKCGEWIVFDDVPGRLRKPTDDELQTIGLDVDAQIVRRAWVETMKENGTWPPKSPNT